MIRPQKALQLETLLELLGKFNGFPWPPPGLLGFICTLCKLKRFARLFDCGNARQRERGGEPEESGLCGARPAKGRAAHGQGAFWHAAGLRW